MSFLPGLGSALTDIVGATIGFTLGGPAGAVAGFEFGNSINQGNSLGTTLGDTGLAFLGAEALGPYAGDAYNSLFGTDPAAAAAAAAGGDTAAGTAAGAGAGAGTAAGGGYLPSAGSAASWDAASAATGLGGFTSGGVGTGAGLANAANAATGADLASASAGATGQMSWLDQAKYGLSQLGVPSSVTGVNPYSGNIGAMAGAGGAGTGPMGILRQGLGGLQLLGGLQNYQVARQRQQQQQQYAQQLQALMNNPSSIMSNPAYIAQQQAVQRSMAAQGYQGSGNMAAALAGAAGQSYNSQISNLASLQGQSAPLTSPYASLGQAGLGAYGLFGGI